MYTWRFAHSPVLMGALCPANLRVATHAGSIDDDRSGMGLFHGVADDERGEQNDVENSEH